MTDDRNVSANLLNYDDNFNNEKYVENQVCVNNEQCSLVDNKDDVQEHYSALECMD